MQNVRTLRQLPQAYGTSGRRMRTPIEQSYAGRGLARMGVPQKPPEQQIAPAPIKQGGPTFSNSYFEGPAGDTEPAGAGGDIAGEASVGGPLGEAIGNSLAGSVAGRGMTGAGLAGLAGLLANAPTSAIAKAIPSFFMQTALAPIGIANNLAGALIGGSEAHETGEFARSLGYSDESADEFAIEAFNLGPKTALGNLMGLASQATGLGSRQTASQVNQDMQTAMLADLAGGLPSPGGRVGVAGNPNMVTTASMLSPFNPLTGAPVFAGNEPRPVMNAPLATNVLSGLTGQVQGETTPTGNFAQSIGTDLSGQGLGGSEGVAPGGSMGPAGTPGAAGMDAGAGAGAGGDGGTVLCTELYRQGIMPEEIYKADEEFGAKLPVDVQEGYRIWAAPLAKLMSRSKIVTGLLKPFVMAWAHHMAGNSNWFGAAAVKIGVPMCKIIRKLAGNQTKSPNQEPRSTGLA